MAKLPMAVGRLSGAGIMGRRPVRLRHVPGRECRL